MTIYRERIDSRSREGQAAKDARWQDRIERDLLLAGVRAERAAIFDFMRDRTIASETGHKLIRELDLIEARYKG